MQPFRYKHIFNELSVNSSLIEIKLLIELFLYMEFTFFYLRRKETKFQRKWNVQARKEGKLINPWHVKLTSESGS